MRFIQFIEEKAEAANTTKYKGVFNWNKENHTLYCSAASPAQATLLLHGQLAKKLKVSTGRVKTYYMQNQNGFKIATA